MKDERVLTALFALDLPTLDRLRSLMRAEQHERDEFASALLSVTSEAGNLLAELIDLSSIGFGRVRNHLRPP
jgi:hypothetical protein